MFKRLSIKARLYSTLGLLGVLLIVIGLLGQIGMQASNRALEHAYSHQLASQIALDESKLNLLIVRTTLDRVLIHPDSPEVPALIDKALNYQAISDKAWKDYEAIPRNAEQEALYSAIASARQTFLQQAILPLVDALKKGDRESADTLTMKTIPPLSVALSKLTNALDEYQHTHGQQSFEAAQDRFTTLSWINGILIVLGLVTCAGCAFSLQRAIGRPLAEILDHFKRIAGGDLTARIETRSQDEMGELTKGLQTMQRSLTDTVRKVTHGSESIATATREIAAGNSDLSQRTEEQAAALQQTAASMEELTATVKQNADNAREAQTLADNAQQIASKGGSVVGEVVGTMNEIDRSSQKIVDIIGVIESIAFQTNILALNAAVEAARAGEQGRGFAVVAGEVRTLAQRSAVAAKEIKELIGESAQRVAAGSRLVSSAGATMQDIQSAVRHVTDIMNEIAAASHEQSDGIEQVNRAVSQMDEVSQQNAALVEQAAAAAASLEEQADGLRRAVSTFQVA
ncbi:HAMP domain-containing protein [Trinickia terrae]|uniref:HAMP domain-containing protein n=1 Tax=Trinickia terrae TaxID=2571161 RepID=A0A4U1IFF5_9BURK|nr:methyl-accepting chemotaxis protein [Trinickia terrae]TKC92464.1 HAMP domain-containing protein [Trinickia terrae]